MKHVLITGGAGFIGINTAYYYLGRGDKVTIFDNLSRKGTAINLKSLQKKYPKVDFIKGDVKEVEEVGKVIRGKDVIFHFAGQVAVTTSVTNPREDFEINALGALNVLETVRTQKLDPIIIYSSTNKVYGDLAHVKIKETATRYEFVDRPHGVSEAEPLDFHSPYGCSKGAADQYMRDYHRIYGLRTIVFRQSCVYGPHQFGVEDQGWVAWFLIAALLGKPLTIYGNGKQVRDILYVDDLVEAYDLAIQKVQVTAGEIYNIGGGAKNSISIWKEFGPMVEELIGKKVSVSHLPERPGDQPIFIADLRKAQKDFGWKPKIEYKEGVNRLFLWLKEHEKIFR